MRTPAESNTKSRILDEAEVLLQVSGYNGFSYKDIAEKLGVKNAAIHYHFAAKSDLGEAVVRRFRERFEKWRERYEKRYENNEVKQLEGFIAIPRSYARNSRVACPIAALEREFEILPEGMREQTKLLDSEMLSWLTNLLAKGKSSGVFTFEDDVVSKSLMVFAALQGASMMVSAGGPQLFEKVVKQIKRDLGLSV